MAAAGISRSYSAAAAAKASSSNFVNDNNFYQRATANTHKMLREAAVNSSTTAFARAWLKPSAAAAAGGGSFINRTTIDSFRQKAQQTATAVIPSAMMTEYSSGNPSEEWVLPYAVVIVAKILYVSIISFAVVGNLCVLLVYLCTRRKRTYFRYVLVNLAVSDLLLACIIPFTMVQVLGNGYWPFSDLMCKAVLYMQLLSVCASVFTLVMVTSSWRWIMSGSIGQRRGAKGNAIQTTNQYSYKPFMALWLTLAIVSCVQLKIAHIEHYPSPTGGNITKCLESGSISPEWGMGYTLFTFGLTYAGPLIHLVINFALIRRKFDKLSRAAAVGRQLERASTPASLLMLGVQHVNPSFSRNQNSDVSSQPSNKSANSPSRGSSAGNGSNSADKRGSNDTVQRNGFVDTTQRRHSPTSPLNHHTMAALGNNSNSANSSIVVNIDGGGGDTTAEDGYKLKVRRKVLRIFKIIVIIFALCWAPLQLFFLIFTFVLPYVVTVKTLMTPGVIGTLQITYIICHLLAMSSACVNPVVLSLTHRNFRNDLKSLTEPVWRYVQPRRLLAYTIHFLWLACCCFLCTACCRDNTYYADAEGEEEDENDVDRAEEGEDDEEARAQRRQLAINDDGLADGVAKPRHYSSTTKSKTGSSGSNRSPRKHQHKYSNVGGRSPEEMRAKNYDEEYEKAVIEKVVSDKSYYFYRQTQPTKPSPDHQVGEQQIPEQYGSRCKKHRQRKQRHEKISGTSGSAGAPAATVSGEHHVSTRRSSSVPSSAPSSLPPMRSRAKPITTTQPQEVVAGAKPSRKTEKANAEKQQQQIQQKKKQVKNKSSSNLSDERSQKKEKRQRSSSHNSRPNNEEVVSAHSLRTSDTHKSSHNNKRHHHHQSATNMLVERLTNKAKSRSKSNSGARSNSCSSSSSSSSGSHYAQAHETSYTEQELREGVIILKPSLKHHSTISTSSVGSSLHGAPQLLRSTIPLVILSSCSSPTHTARYAAVE